MDFMNRYYKQQTGFLSPFEYSHRLNYEFTTRVTEESLETIGVPSSLESIDFDISNNWLVVSHPGFCATIYNMRRSSALTYSCVQKWRDKTVSVPRSICRFPFECVNWSRQNKFFTMSGNSPYVFIVDTITSTTVEKVLVPEISKIYQHKPQPQNTAILATACSTKGVPIIDLRTGNVSITIRNHSSQTVAWSPVEEYLLASGSEYELRLWDTRMTKRPRVIKMKNIPCEGLSYNLQACVSKIIPEIQFIPGTNELVGLSADKKLYRLDAYCGKVKASAVYPTRNSIRYKFALVGYASRPLLFLPTGINISVMDLTDFEVIHELTGHVFPVRALVYNTLKNELYSTSREGNLVWVAPRSVS